MSWCTWYVSSVRLWLIICKLRLLTDQCRSCISTSLKVFCFSNQIITDSSFSRDHASNALFVLSVCVVLASPSDLTLYFTLRLSSCVWLLWQTGEEGESDREGRWIDSQAGRDGQTERQRQGLIEEREERKQRERESGERGGGQTDRYTDRQTEKAWRTWLESRLCEQICTPALLPMQKSVPVTSSNALQIVPRRKWNAPLLP